MDGLSPPEILTFSHRILTICFFFSPPLSPFFSLSHETKSWCENLDAPKIPGMIFGNNFMAMTHEESKLQISFNAYDALKAWRAAPWFTTALSVAYAKEWKDKRDVEDMCETMKYDWTYTTPYTGCISIGGKDLLEEDMKKTTDTLDLELLKRPGLFPIFLPFFIFVFCSLLCRRSNPLF
jgi:TIP41-like family